MKIELSLERCGFGFAGGLFPEARLGLVRINFYGPTIAETFEQYEAALNTAKLAIMERDAEIKQLTVTVGQLTLALEGFHNPPRAADGRFRAA